MTHVGGLPKQRTESQIQFEIGTLRARLNSLKEWLHTEPWNYEVRQDFRTTQNRLNSALSELTTLMNS